MKKFGFMAAAGLAATMVMGAAAAHAEGDAASGEKVAKKCIACHDFSAGGPNKVGPNLHDVAGRTIGTHEGYKYSDSYVQLGEKGETWDDEKLAAYLKDPRGWIKEATGDDKAKTKMTFKLTKDDEIADVIAYLKTLN